MLILHIPARIVSALRTLSVALLISIVSGLPHLPIFAQTVSFFGDTLVAPHLFDLQIDGVLHDFHIDDSILIYYIGRADGQGTNYDCVIRDNGYGTGVDTMYKNVSPPAPNSFYHFDAKGKAIALGFGFHSTKHRYLMPSTDAGQSWDTVDIGDSSYYRDLRVVDAEAWLLESGSPFDGLRYVTPDTAYWIFDRERTRSSIQLFDNDSILLFVRKDGCSINERDTAYFQFLKIGDVADSLTAVVVPTTSRPPLPTHMTCPRYQIIGFDGRRIWFTRTWFPDHIDSTLVWPTAVYSYELSTGMVEYEHFFPRPDSWPRAILFEDHVFVSLDSQLVYRHIDDPPLSPFREVVGVHTGLANLQVHDGALYGSRSSGLIMRISQVSSVSTPDAGKSAAFIAEIQGSEITVHAVDGAVSYNVRLELFDVQGRRLSTSSIASGSNSGRLPTPAAPGVYFLRCGGSETSTTMKIIVPLP